MIILSYPLKKQHIFVAPVLLSLPGKNRYCVFFFTWYNEIIRKTAYLVQNVVFVGFVTLLLLVAKTALTEES